METNGKKLYTTHQVAKFLGVTPITVIRWIENGKLHCYTTLGGHRRIDHNDLTRFTHEHNLPWLGAEDSQNGSKDYKVLVVDDEADIRTHFQDAGKYLTDMKVVHVSDAFAAGAKLVESKPDLIWINLSMTGLDGTAFCGYVRNDPRYRDIPILAVAHATTRLATDRLKAFGVIDIMLRPFVNSLLIKRIEVLRSFKYQSKAA